jgi:transposase InsO family protein
VEKMCQILDVSRSSYYAWLKRPESKRSRENKVLLEEIKAAYDDSRKTYGSLRVHAELKRKNIKCSKNRVARIMKENNIISITKRKYKVTTDSNHSFPVSENILAQDFAATAPNEKWVTDITYIPTTEGWLYLAAILDLYTKEIVGMSMSTTMTRQLVIDALNNAKTRKRPPRGIIHHSDRGSQYASHDYQKVLKKNGFIGSMSRKGNCYDNACIESFWGTLKTELIYRNPLMTRDEARLAIFEYVEVFYNRKRLHSALGYKTPLEMNRSYYAKPA